MKRFHVKYFQHHCYCRESLVQIEIIIRLRTKHYYQRTYEHIKKFTRLKYRKAQPKYPSYDKIMLKITPTAAFKQLFY